MSGAHKLTSTQIRILRFFHEHPQAMETVRGMAVWLGEEEGAVGQALQDLSARKWLAADETSAVTAYSLTPDDRLLSQLQELLETGG